MAEVKLSNITETLVINCEGEKYSIPLADDLPYTKLLQFKQDKDFLALMRGYAPDEFLDTLTSRQIKQIVQAWNDATIAATGVTPGES